MPRVKTKAVRRPIPTSSSDTEASSPPKRPKRTNIGGVKRKVLNTPPPDLPLIGPLTLFWDENNKSSTVAQLLVTGVDDDSYKVMADDKLIQCSAKIADILKKTPKTCLVILDSLDEEKVDINIALRVLPVSNMRPLAELVTGNDYSEFEEISEVPDTAWGQFFQEMEEMQKSLPRPVTDFQHADLLPTLRGYQSAAVSWMVERESITKHLDISWLPQVADEIKTTDGKIILYNKFSKVIYDNIPPTPICSGGILADEMGLGKTVITLALLLNNKRTCLEDSKWEMVVGEKVETPKKRSSISTRELNQESSLDATEQLQVVSPTPGRGMLRAHLSAWYESMLAEVSVRRTSASPVRSVPFKCTCGEDVSRMPRNAVECGSCGLRQHPSCCGYQPEETYLCPSCWRLQAPVPSRATLIVTPPAIYAQWVSEIKRHAPSLNLLQYSGCKDAFIQPSYMANFDVVLTTYPVLRTETLYTQESSERCLRNEGRFLKISSPLEKVGWWRVVCDEAQMVESDMSQARIMTQKLTANHRWCVTGTPIQRGVSDLFYLTSFMGLGVFDNKNTWTDFILKPYLGGCKEPLHSMLSQVFWRSTKEEVSAELGLPEQTFQRHLLKFTAIEETFYMQLHAASAEKFAEGLRKSGIDVNLPLDSLDKSFLKKILQPLLNLRQACTHAQVVRGITISSASGAANLGELLQYLCKKTKQECEEALRRHVAALNGLAGLHCLEQNWSSAVENYRAVLQMAEECDKGVHVDKLQRIHALTNLDQVLKSHSSGIPPTLRDDRLLDDAKQLEEKYLSKPEESFASSLAMSKTLSVEVSEILKEFESSPGTWWVPVILSVKEYEREVIDKLTEVLHSNDPLEKAAAKSFLCKVSSLRGVEFTVKQWWAAIEKHHKAVSDAMSVLTSTPCSLLVEQALNCHLRAIEQKEKCDLCKVERKLLDLECELFATTRKKTTKREKVLDGAETKGSWKAHSAERTLFIVLSFARGKSSLESWCLRDGKKHSQLLEAMKKEFKNVRATWTALNHRVHAEDELTMAKLRLRLAEPWETNHRPDILALTTPAKAETRNLVPAPEIPIMMLELAADRDSALSDFRKKQGRMSYLENLGKDRNAKPEPCPICKSSLDQQWCVFYCGHCFCIDCLRMISTGTSRRVKCPVCREFTESSDVGFVDTTASGAVNNIDVKGDYSTKVDNIVREVLSLLQDDASVKILIFSTWVEVLKILAKALTTNGVKFLSLPHTKHQVILETFRDMESGISVLLLPLAWGSKGLNLIEATHVFLAEPILNPAEELQAIGRIHRIGQTKPTFVHRFIIKGTVEEKIFEAVSEAKDTWSNKSTTLSDLQKLFIIPDRQNKNVE